MVEFLSRPQPPVPRHAIDASPEERAEGTYLDVKVFGFAGGGRCRGFPKPKTDGVVGNAGGPTVAGSAAVPTYRGLTARAPWTQTTASFVLAYYFRSARTAEVR
jgi:hypothetical protein